MRIRISQYVTQRLLLCVLFAATYAAGAEEAPLNERVRVAFVGSVSESTAPRAVAAFWAQLREFGWVEGKNLIPETSWADGHVERLPKLMSNAVARRTDVLVTFGTPAATAARSASQTIPIVVMAMGDPVATGLAESLAHPGRNLTGLSGALEEQFVGKWLELLQESVPRVKTVAVLGQIGNLLNVKVLEALEAAASERGLSIRFFGLKADDGIAAAVEEARRHAQALLVL